MRNYGRYKSHLIGEGHLQVHNICKSNCEAERVSKNEGGAGTNRFIQSSIAQEFLRHKSQQHKNQKSTVS